MRLFLLHMLAYLALRAIKLYSLGLNEIISLKGLIIFLHYIPIFDILISSFGIYGKNFYFLRCYGTYLFYRMYHKGHQTKNQQVYCLCNGVHRISIISHQDKSLDRPLLSIYDQEQLYFHDTKVYYKQCNVFLFLRVSYNQQVLLLLTVLQHDYWQELYYTYRSHYCNIVCLTYSCSQPMH